MQGAVGCGEEQAGREGQQEAVRVLDTEMGTRGGSFQCCRVLRQVTALEQPTGLGEAQCLLGEESSQPAFSSPGDGLQCLFESGAKQGSVQLGKRLCTKAAWPALLCT